MSKKYTILVDTHVHIYDCYNVTRFFVEADRNFSDHNKKLKLAENYVGILFLTESNNFHYFEKLRDNSNNIILDLEKEGFFKKESDESCSLVFETADSNFIIIIAGQQVITEEKLEVLSLGTLQKIKYSLSLEETISNIKGLGAIPVLPWGVGKWLGKRRGAVHAFIKENRSAEFFLGDNSGRPALLKTPALFNLARQNKKLVLRGSDPLPIKSQEKKAGGFGFYFISEIDIQKPFKEIKRMIYNSEGEPNNYGALENLFDFFKNQFKLRLNKTRAK